MMIMDVIFSEVIVVMYWYNVDLMIYGYIYCFVIYFI